MIHFFDTSALVAAFDDQDAHHNRAQRIFFRHADGGSIANHSLAETFSILTGRRAWRGSDASQIISGNTELLEKINLSSAEYLNVLEHAEGTGIRGGAIYDALILACARKARATSIWTFNVRHFLLFAGDLRDKIREP
jgi:predicted nucleic acid-binding protein